MSQFHSITDGDVVRLKQFPVRGKNYVVQQVIGGQLICLHEPTLSSVVLCAADVFVVRQTKKFFNP